MIERLKSLFAAPSGSKEPPGPALAGAALMFEVAWADHDVDDAELALMSEQLQHLFDLDASELAEILAETRGLHDTSVGVHPFTRAINDSLELEQKFQIICALWRVALADEKLDRFEEHTIRRIADLLYVPHSKFIEAKLLAKNRL